MILLIETPGDGGPAGARGAGAFLAGEIEAGRATDALIAQSGQDRARFWAYRESPYGYRRILPPIVGFDISIPIGSMDEAVRAMRADLSRDFPDIVQVYFGHLADSNLHLIATRDGFDAAFKKAVEALVYGHVAAFGGSISAEHGVGRLKRPYLALSRSAPNSR